MKVQVKFVKVKEPQKWDAKQSCFVDVEDSKDYEFVIVKEGLSYINGIKIKKEFYNSLKRPLLPPYLRYHEYESRSHIIFCLNILLHLCGRKPCAAGNRARIGQSFRRTSYS